MIFFRTPNVIIFGVFKCGRVVTNQLISMCALIIQEIKYLLYFITITSQWAKRLRKQNSAKLLLLMGGKLYLPTLIGRNSPCTKLQWMMGAVCHQQTSLSYTAENRNVIIFGVIGPGQYRRVAIIWHGVKTCKYH